MSASTDASTKPSVAELGIDLAAPTSPPAPAWRRSGTGGGAIEVAFLDGAKKGEFDDAAAVGGFAAKSVQDVRPGAAGPA